MSKSNKDVLYTEIYGAKVGLPQFYDEKGEPVAISVNNPLPVSSGGGSGGMRFHSGEGVPGTDVGQPGDIYLDTSTGDLYNNQNGSWVEEMNLKGPQGPAGTDGEDGEQGPQGEPGQDAEPQFTEEEVAALKALISEE